MGAAVQRDGRRPSRRRRRDPDRQDEPRRVRHGLLDGELGLRPDAQPARPRSRPRRVVGRLGRRRGRGDGGDRPRLGHGGLDPPARGALRRGRGQADLRDGLAVRAHRLRELARPDRAARHDGGRRRRVPRGDRRPRPDGCDLPRRAGAAGGRRARRRRGRCAGGPRRRAAGRRGARRRRRGRARGRGARGGRRARRRAHAPRAAPRALGVLPDRAGRGAAPTSPATTASATGCASTRPTCRP